MKKVFLVLLLICLFSVVGCSDEYQPPSDNQPTQVTTQSNNSADDDSYDGFKAGEDAAEAMMMSVAAN